MTMKALVYTHPLEVTYRDEHSSAADGTRENRSPRAPSLVTQRRWRLAWRDSAASGGSTTSPP